MAAVHHLRRPPCTTGSGKDAPSLAEGVHHEAGIIAPLPAECLHHRAGVRNKHPSHWRSNFNEDDSLLCALDRIFDDATVFKSFRGKKLETIALQTSRVKTLDSSETPTP